MEIKAGSKIEWMSAAGHLTGTVSEVQVSPSAAGTMVPWIYVKQITNVLTGRHNGDLYLCGSNDMIVGMKIRAIKEAA